MRDRHPLAGRTVTLKSTTPELGGRLFLIEDWWQNVSGKSWKSSAGHPAAMQYAMRNGFSGEIRLDDEVLYGKIGAWGCLIHVSEIVSDGGPDDSRTHA